MAQIYFRLRWRANNIYLHQQWVYYVYADSAPADSEDFDSLEMFAPVRARQALEKPHVRQTGIFTNNADRDTHVETEK